MNHGATMLPHEQVRQALVRPESVGESFISGAEILLRRLASPVDAGQARAFLINKMDAIAHLPLSERRSRLESSGGLERLRLLNSIAGDLVSRNLEEARALTRKSAELAEALLGENTDTPRTVRGEQAEAWRLMGVIDIYRAEYATAVQHLEAAQARFRESDHREGPGQCWNNLAMVYRYLDDYGRALSYYEKALARTREIGDGPAETDTLGNIGHLYYVMGEWTQAEMFIRAAQERAVDRAEEALEMVWSNYLAEIYLAQDKLDRALPLLRRARELSELRDDTALRIEIWRNFGMLRTKQRDFPAAYRAYREAVVLAESFCDRRRVIDISLAVGRLLLGLSSQEIESVGVSAADVLEKALNGAEAIGVASLRREAHETLAECYEKQGNCEQAYRHLRKKEELALVEKTAETERKLRQQRLLFEVDQTRRELDASREANVQLRFEVSRREQMESDLRNALIQARLADEVKTRFLATMSHEIRTPMNGILGMTDVLSRSTLSQDQQEAVQVILEAGNSLLDLINNILDLTKLEAGQTTLLNDDFSLMQVVHKVAIWGEQEASKRNLRFTFRSDPWLDRIFKGDAARWEQLLLILISNAVKFTPSGGVTLKVEPGEAGQVRCIVEDTGIGIPADRRERIFEVFTQLDSSTTRHYGGVGLGLAIARKLTQLMGGSLSVSSQENIGSQFVLELPLEPGEGLEEHDTPPAPKRSGRRLKVLVVDDTEFNWRVVSLLLKKLDVDADWACDGFQALEKIEAEAFDLILMDVQMPGIDGVETTRRIRRNRTLKQQPHIVALTAYPLREHDDPLLEAGIDDYLSKPIDLTRLREAIIRVR